MAGLYLSSIIFAIGLCFSIASDDESTCSKFMYNDKQMLETMVRLEAKMDQMDRERKAFEENVVSTLEHRGEEIERKLKKQNEHIDSVFKDYNDIREELKNKMLQVEELVDTKPKVAFNAYTKSGGSYDVGEILIFPNVLLNEGGGYDKNSGVFTAPVAGLYHFSAHICNLPEFYAVVAIVHRSTEIAISTAYENGSSSCSSVMAPVIMKKGERVHVKSRFTSSKLMADSNHRWPSFTGVLLNI